MCANEVLREAGHTDAALIPDTEVIRHALTERNMLTGLVSDKDPLGIFFSTRIAGEWRYAYRDQTIKPMSPAEYAAQEKTLAEFIVSWSQKRLARGVVVSFIEGGMDVVGGLTVTPIKIGIRAGIKVPISLIRIGYDVHKIKQGVMPGEDKPYKVIKGRITHRLEQLGFKMLMIPVGNTVKTVFAAGVSAAAHAHNAMVEKEQDKVKISSWAKVLGTEALLTGGSVPVSVGAKTAADLVMEPSPKLTTDEQQVVEQIKQALAGESASEELDAVDESSPISNAYPDINRGEGEYKEAVDKSLAKIARTPLERDLIESMNKQGIKITQPSEEERLRQEDGQTYYATYANPEQNTIFFDPWNTLAAESDEQANDKPWLRRDPSIALFHEMLHLYYHSHPVKVNYQNDWLTIDELGAKLAPEGSSEEEKESLSHGIFEHFVAGADYDANDVHLAFAAPSFIEQSVQVDNGRYISENDYREAFYRAQGQAVIKRLDYGDSSFTGHDGDRYAPSSQSGEDQEEDWQYKVSETHIIEIKGTQEYFDDVSVVLDDLKDTEQGKRLLEAMSSPQFSIRLPAKEVLDGVEYYPASADLDNNIIYFDPLSTLSLNGETSGDEQAQIILFHELLHLYDNNNLANDSYSDDIKLLEHMVVGLPYTLGEDVLDFSDTNIKKQYLRDGSQVFTVNQLREELGIDPRLHYSDVENTIDGRAYFRRPISRNAQLHISLLQRVEELEEKIRVARWNINDADSIFSRPYRKRQRKKIAKWERELSDNIQHKLDQLENTLPAIEKVAYAKLWTRDAQALRPETVWVGGDLVGRPHLTTNQSEIDKERQKARKYLESSRNELNQRGLGSSYTGRFDNQVRSLDEFKEEMIQDLNSAYASGDMVKVYAWILAKKQSLNELMAREGNTPSLRQQKALLEEAERIIVGQRNLSRLPEVRQLFFNPSSDQTMNLAEEITNDISASSVFEGYRWPLLPTEMMYLEKRGFNTKETLLDKILQYRQGRGELHENIQQVEAEFYASMKDIVQDNETYTVAQQREEIQAHGGLIAYEREVMNKTYMAYFFDRVSPDSAAYRYWKENSIDQPGKVKFAIEHIDRTPRQVDDYIKENKGTGYRGLERLIGKQITYSSGLSQEHYTISYQNIESALGKEYLYSVNQEELGSVNWSTERYTKLLRERATEKIESIADDTEKAATLNILDRALNPVQYREDPRDIPHIIKPYVGYPRESIGEIIKGDSYPLENMMVIIDGDNYTMISLMPDGQVHNFSSRQELNRFFRNPSNHEYLLSHASLYNQMDGRSKKGMATILEELSASKDHRNDNRYILTNELKHRMDAKSVFSSLAAGSKGYYQSKLYSEIDLVTAVKKHYRKGLSDTGSVITEPSYVLPETYQNDSFNKLYGILKHKNADLQPMITGQIDDFKNNHLDVFKGYLKTEYKNIVNKAQLEGILSSQEATDIINHPERMFIPSLRNQVKHYPLEGMLMTKRGNTVILISLQSNGGVHKFDSERDFNLFFANPANKDYILSHMSERNKQPRGIKGKGPSDFLDTLASWSNKYYRTSFVAEELPVAHPADKFPMIGPQSPDEIINEKPVRFNADDDAFEIMATCMLDRLRSDADTLLTSHSEWKTDKFFEISGYVLAAASIVLTAGAAAGVGGVYVAGSAFVVDMISAAHGITEGLYVVIQGDTPEQRKLGLLPLVLAPLDMFGAAGGAAELRRLGKAGGTVSDSLATGGRRLPPVEESNEFDGIRAQKNRRRSIRAVLDNFGLTRRGNSQPSAFDALPQMEQSPSWYNADNLYTPKTSAHGVIFKDPDNPNRLIKFYKRPSDRGIAENNRDVLNKLYDQNAELNTLRGIDGETYYAVNMPKMKGISIENIEDPDVMLDLLRRIEEDDFIAHWVGKLQDNGIRVEDLNLGSVLYDPSTREFSLVDFDSSTISDSVSNSHYKQMYRSLHTPIRDQLVKKAKTLFEGQGEMLDTVTRVEEKLNLRFKDLMKHNEYGEESFSTLMKGQNDTGDREGWGSARLPMGGDTAGSQPVPSTNGRNIYGHDNPMSKPRQDVNSDGSWAGEQGTFYDDVDLTDILPDDRPWTNLGTSSRPRSVDFEGNSYRIKYTDERSAEAGRTTQYRASLISDSGEEIPVRIKVATHCSEAYAYVGKSGSPMNTYMPDLVGVTDSQGLPISDIGRGQIREEPIFLILRDEVKALEETGSSIRKVLDVKFSDVRLRSTPAERAVNGYPEKSSLYYAAKNKAMDSSGIPFINHNGGNELNKFLAIRNTKKKLLSVLNMADNLDELKAQLESFRQAVMASDWVSYDSSLLLIAHAKNGQTKIDFKFIDPAHPVTRQAGTNSQALNSGKSAMQDSINWLSEEIDQILYRRSAVREGLMSYESPTSSRILSSSSAEDLTVLDDIVVEEGFKPYIKPNGRDYIYFPFMNDERVTERLIPLLRDRISNGKPPIEIVFKNREQIDSFREILNRVFPANSRLEADLEYLYTSANKMDLRDLRDSDTLYVSGHGQPGQGYVYSAASPNADKVSARQVARDLDGMLLPDDVTVKVAACNSASEHTIIAPSSRVDGDLYAHITDPVNMGDFDASLAGKLEIALKTFQEGRELGKVYGYLGYITNRRIQTGMGKIEGGQLTFGSSTHAVAGFDILGDSSARLVDFRRSDMMRGRFYDPNPMLGKHGLQDLPSDLPPLNPALRQEALKPKLLKRRGLALIQAQGSEPNTQVYFAEAEESSAQREAWNTVWENTARTSDTPNTDLFVAYNGKQLNIEDIVKHMDSGGLQQYKEASGYIGTNPVSFVRIVRVSKDGDQEENQYEITVETLETQFLE
ncbi:M91 family zinc metallopeptidase [Vibrio sp.]|uniref:M91 family zinc metallopeptidase n=1 Tax=Vibrio sp. TaxID=678 RepID=UPI00311F01D1